MTSRKVSELDERVERMRKSEHLRQGEDIFGRAIKGLSEEERLSLTRAIIAWDKEKGNITDDAWLATRPQDQQAVVRKVLARFQELEQA